MSIEIFVFGSNLAGRHGAGAALTARQKYGAIYGQGSGPQGYSYAIPTKDAQLRTLPLYEIQMYVNRFLKYVACQSSRNRQMKFKVTAIGCGLAGYTPEQIAPMFQSLLLFDNVELPESFLEVLA